MSSSFGDSASISGHLGTIGVQDVLGFLSSLRHDGVLEIESPDGELTLYLEAGDVVGGRATCQEGKGGDDLAAAELSDCIFRLFSWKPGEFRFYEGAELPAGMEPVRIEIQGLLLEAARRCTDWNRLPATYADPAARFEITNEPKRGGSISLGLDEWKLLYLVTNGRRLDEIWETSSLGSRFETSRTLFGLVSARLIRPRGETTRDESFAPTRLSASGTIPLPRGLAPPAPALSLGGIRDAWDGDADTVPMMTADEVGEQLDAGDTDIVDPAGAGFAPAAEGVPTPPPRRLTRTQIRIERTGSLIQLVPVGQESAFKLAGGQMTIGRAADNDLIVADGHVSGHHARISRDGDHFAIDDTHSSNGIRVNGRSAFHATLQGGDEIEIYPYRFRFEVSFEISEADERSEDG